MLTFTVLLIAVFSIGIVTAHANWLGYRLKIKELEARVIMNQEETARLEILKEIQSEKRKSLIRPGILTSKTASGYEPDDPMPESMETKE